MMKVQRDLHIRNRPTRLNRANSNSTMRKMLLVGIKTTTNIGFVGDDDRSAGYDVTEAGLQITADILPPCFTNKDCGRSFTSSLAPNTL